MEKSYRKPILQKIELESEDIITTSGGGGVDHWEGGSGTGLDTDIDWGI